MFPQAASEGLAYMQSRVGGSGGLVAVDVFGRWSFAGPVSSDNLVHCYLNFSIEI